MNMQKKFSNKRIRTIIVTAKHKWIYCISTNSHFYYILLTALIFQSCSIFNKTRITPIEQKKPLEEISINEITVAEKKNSDRLWGIDISHYQKIEDWNKIVEHEPGFIFVKATEGSTHQDPKYPEYYQSIRKHKIPVGSYHFFTYLSSGKDQAKNFLSVAQYKKGDLPLVLDIEFAKKMPEKPTIEKEVLAFINTIYDKTKCYPIVYCDYKYHSRYLKDCLPDKCKLWIVDYRSKPDCNWTFWQITEKYTVAGIKGYVDFNLFNGTEKDFKSLIY
jgi:lysozyme